MDDSFIKRTKFQIIFSDLIVPIRLDADDILARDGLMFVHQDAAEV